MDYVILKTSVVFFFIVWAPSPVSASPPTPQNKDSLHITDASGTPIPCSQATTGIAALAPNVAQVISELGLIHRLKAVASKSHWEEGAALKNIEDIGAFHAPDLERLLLFKNNVFIATKNGTPLKTFEALKKKNSAVIAVDFSTIDAMKEAYRILGCAFGAIPEAQKHIMEFDQTLRHAHISFKKMAQEKRRVLLLLSLKPLMAVHPSTLLGEIITHLGFVPIALPHDAPYAEIDLEWATQQKPSIIFLFSKDTSEKNTALFKSSRTLQLRDPSWIRHTLQITRGIKELEGLLHP